MRIYEAGDFLTKQGHLEDKMQMVCLYFTEAASGTGVEYQERFLVPLRDDL